MKKFETPEMIVQKFEPEIIIEGSSSSCFETFECKDCYCGLVQCPTGYSCKGLVCPGLD